MAAKTKIAVCLMLAVLSIWFSYSFRNQNVSLDAGTWEHMTVAEESSDSGDSTETDFG